jgi:hypothetical protein
MPADFIQAKFTVPPGKHVLSFYFNWVAGNHPNKGPVVCIISPDNPPTDEEAKLIIEDFGCARKGSGPVCYSGWITNTYSKPIKARLMGVYFPEFQSDWEM